MQALLSQICYELNVHLVSWLHFVIESAFRLARTMLFGPDFGKMEWPPTSI
jgi:hypothetical protein